jgi:hypothetical protein
LAVIPVSLAKIFLYDLPSLSSITRALSFLAVGAVLLLGGFFYSGSPRRGELRRFVRAATGILKSEVGDLRGEWSTYTPDGRPLRVKRERNTWVAQCGRGRPAQNKLLDVALIEAIRQDPDVIGHGHDPDYAAWTRDQADRIERDLSAGL